MKTADYLAAGTVHGVPPASGRHPVGRCQRGTQQVWIVEPTTRTVTLPVYRPGGPAARVYGADDTLDGGDLLPGLALPVGDLFEYRCGGSISCRVKTAD